MIIKPFPFISTGLTVQTFQGLPTVLQLVCSAHILDPGLELFMLALKQLPDTPIAHVNFKNRVCSTNKRFSACKLHNGDDRFSQLRTLLMNLTIGEMNRFECKASFELNGNMDERSWYLDVIYNGKF